MRAREAPRRRRLALGALVLVSASLFLFSVAGIARVGTSSEPSAPVVSAARDALRGDDAYPSIPEWGDDAFWEARPDRFPCRKRGKRVRLKS